MGEAVSTASLTVEDIGEKFPESKSELRWANPALLVQNLAKFKIRLYQSETELLLPQVPHPSPGHHRQARGHTEVLRTRLVTSSPYYNSSMYQFFPFTD